MTNVYIPKEYLGKGCKHDKKIHSFTLDSNVIKVGEILEFVVDNELRKCVAINVEIERVDVVLIDCNLDSKPNEENELQISLDTPHGELKAETTDILEENSIYIQLNNELIATAEYDEEDDNIKLIVYGLKESDEPTHVINIV